MFRHCSFDATKNRFDYYRGKDSMKKFCKDLEDQVMKIIKCEKKEKITLMSKENKLY